MRNEMQDMDYVMIIYILRLEIGGCHVMLAPIFIL
jgi:hypothetical protein